MYVTSYDLASFDPAKRWCAEGFARFPKNPQFSLCQLQLLFATANSPNIAEAWHHSNEIARLTPQQDSALARRMAQMYVACVIAPTRPTRLTRTMSSSVRAPGPDIDPRGELMALEALARARSWASTSEAISSLERYLTAHPDTVGGFGKANAGGGAICKMSRGSRIVAGIGR